tara:strand:- start:922 stop:1509 length:588 start_codon:yes stop_codon:yes gene_type:complete
MNILKRFVRNAISPTSSTVDLFYDMDENAIAYLDKNNSPQRLLTKQTDFPSQNYTLLIRTDGINVEKITAQNTLPSSSYLFDLSVLGAVKGEASTYILKNMMNTKEFSNMDITNINFSTLFSGTDLKTIKEVKINWLVSPLDSSLHFQLINPDGTPFMFSPGLTLSIWLNIEVFNNIEREVLVIKSKTPSKPKRK